MLFQQQILVTLLAVEKTYNLLAEHDTRNVLIVCDRGAMDPFACEFTLPSVYITHNTYVHRTHTHLIHTHTHTAYKQSVRWRTSRRCSNT